MTDHSQVLGKRAKPTRLLVYPTLEHFHRASESGWMRPFDLAEYEACRDAGSQRTTHPFAPAEMRHTSPSESGNGVSEEVLAGADRELAAAG